MNDYKIEFSRIVQLKKTICCLYETHFKLTCLYDDIGRLKVTDRKIYTMQSLIKEKQGNYVNNMSLYYEYFFLK